ncbi:MAG: protein kinase [Deltaproteobacteria bacterium]|jgi:serine/threonine-protein kinase|nr:protein kinase [Deltaproteobacteria bacterium]
MEENSVDRGFLEGLSGIKNIGRYEIVSKLGRGGSGIVFLAKDPYIKRKVAIKVAQTVTDRARERFLVEAQSAGQFSHPNIVSIHDVGLQADFCYIAMEYIEGHTLERYCDKNNLLPVQKVIEIILSVCSALEYSHHMGVIHRDIKPANIMLDEKGITKITDFGVAQMIEEIPSTGFFGTPSYMSPEQVKESAIGFQSDIFSLGCVLYELLSGEQAFPGDNNFSIIYKISNTEPPPILSIRPDLPGIIGDILKKALAKVTHERHQTCSELAYDLRIALRGISGSAVASDKIKDVADYISHLKFFQSFPHEEVREIVSLSQILKIGAGKKIVSEGEIDDTFYILMSGRAAVRKNKDVIGIINTGDCIGEMALIGSQKRIADVTADSDCILLKISASLLDNASDSLKHLFFKNFAVTLVQRLSLSSRSKQPTDP